jgi:outer membrane receptor protein involved in Fe transport
MRLISVITFLLFLAKGYSQGYGRVNGFIVEKSTNNTVEFATVLLIKDIDSTQIQNTVTNAKGYFEFKNIAEGKYKVSYSFIGFTKAKSQTIEINAANKTIKLDKLYLEDASVNLNTVEIVGQKSTFETSIDRKTYNVGQDIMSKTGTISDVLQNVPTVQVDVDGKVSLRGSSNVIVLINGKPSGMMNQNAAAMLQQMPSDMVEKIEIITNPSAKYKPDGAVGILNIVLKKNKGLGTNGNFTANIGNDERYNAGLYLNYNPGKLNVFGNYNYRQDDYKRLNDASTQTFQEGKETSDVINTSNSHSRPVTNIFGLGLDYDWDNKNSFGVTSNFNHIWQCRNENSSFLKDTLGKVLNDYSRNRHPPKLETNWDMAGRIQHKFKKEGHEVNINYLNSLYTESSDNSFTNTFHVPEVYFNLDKVCYRHYTHLSQFLAEYVNPLSKTSKLEAGYEFEFKQNEMKIHRDTFLTNSYETIFTDYSRTTHFQHNEYSHAAYITFQHEVSNFGFLIGLRGETTNAASDLYSNITIVRLQYTRLYPTLHTLYKIAKNQDLQLNYSRRIRRPADEDLNPYPQYLDMWNIPKGNPYLKPEDIHSLELGYKLKQQSVTFLSTLYYRYTKNGITSIAERHGDTLISTLQNLSTSKATGLEIALSTGIGKWVNVNLSSNIFYNAIDASILGYSKNKSTFSFTTKANAYINITKKTIWQVSSNYVSSRLTPQGKLLPSFVLNTGLKQKILNKKGSLILTISDIFNSLRSNLLIDTPELQRHEYKKRSARIIYLGFTYSFGSNGKKEKENNLQYDNKL